MEVTGAIDKNPVVSTNYIGRGLQILRNISQTKKLSENELTHTAHNNTRESPRYIFTIILFLIF